MIRDFGILNTNIPDDHKWSGVPYPGTYMVDEDGRVFDKSFFAGHGTRESVNDMLQESFLVRDVERGLVQEITTPHLIVKAYFASPTIRQRQYSVLSVEVTPVPGFHVTGRDVPQDYVPIELAIVAGEDIEVEGIDYPDQEYMTFETLRETIPVYKGPFTVKARCLGTKRVRDEENSEVKGTLSYQACDDRQCYIPETLTLSVPLRYLPHVK